MSFNGNVLTPVFSEIFYRRPIDVKLAGAGKIKIKAGSHENCNVEGKYLEGQCSLYSNSSRLNIQDVHQHGELENTNITSVINASNGDDEFNISLYGYVAGQEGNATAKFNINNCIDIEETTPVIFDFTATIYNPAYPESILFSVLANEEVKAIIIYGQETTLREFIYTFPAPGVYQVSIQGKNANGELSNIITKQVEVYQRPYITGVNVTRNDVGARLKNDDGSLSLYSFFTYIIGNTYYDRSVITGNIIPVLQIYLNDLADLTLQPQYVLGGLNAQIAGVTIQSYQNGGAFGFSLQQASPHLIYLYVNAQKVNSRGYINLMFYPWNTLNTAGYRFEMALDVTTYNSDQFRIADFPNFNRPPYYVPTSDVFGSVEPGININLIDGFRSLLGFIAPPSGFKAVTGVSAQIISYGS